MNLRFKETFTGKVVNKKLTFNTGMDEFPRYVLEYLIDNYCTEETFAEDFERVKRRLRENFVHGAEAERIRAHIRENREHTIIANLEVRLVETEDKYWGTIGAILYFFSVGLSLTFGTMHIINFAHGMVYALGVYLFITFMGYFGNSFLLSLVVSLVAYAIVMLAILIPLGLGQALLGAIF